MFNRFLAVALAAALVGVLSTSDALAQSGTRGGYSAPSPAVAAPSYASPSYAPSYNSPTGQSYSGAQGVVGQPYEAQGVPSYGAGVPQIVASPTYGAPCSSSAVVARPAYTSYRPTYGLPLVRRFFGMPY